MKKVISLVLVVCMLGIALVACGGNKDPKTTDDSGKPSTTEVPTNKWGETDLGVDENKWATVNFNGETLTVLVLNDEKVSREWEVEDVGDDELDQQIFQRNELVESNLGLDVTIRLTNTCVAGSEWNMWNDTFTPLIQQDIDNKLHEIDVVANFGFSGMNTTLRDYYVDVHDEDTLPHFDFSLPCWNQAIIENGTLNGKLYLIAGDLNISLFNASMVIWHNMDLYDRVKDVDGGDADDIQQLVMSGDWTYAELYKWAGYYEAGGDNTSCSDTYGVMIGSLIYPTQPLDAIPYAWNVSFFSANNDGTYSFNIVGNEKAEKIKTAFSNLYYSTGNATKAYENGTASCSCEGGHFIGGNVLFNSGVMYWTRETSNQLRDVDFRYSLLPWPKWDENQEDYYTTSQDYFTTMSILDHSASSVPTKGEEISAYLQYSAEYSYENVRGYYFHKIVKSKLLGTDDSDGHVTNSWSIFCTIIDNLQFDFACIYGQMLDHVLMHIWRSNVLPEGSTSIQNKFDAANGEYDRKLADLNSWFGLTE